MKICNIMEPLTGLGHWHTVLIKTAATIGLIVCFQLLKLVLNILKTCVTVSVKTKREHIYWPCNSILLKLKLLKPI